MGVEVVQHHANHLSMRIGPVHQTLHLVSEIYRCASFGHLQVYQPLRGSKNMNRFRVPLRLCS